MNEEAKPWQRQKGEPNLWYDRFTHFRLMGPDRSLLAAYNEWQDTKGRKRTRTPATSWRKACEKWQWRERAEAWDEAQRAEAEAEWQRRRQEIRNIEWEKAQELLAQAEKMLKLPVVERVVDHGGEMVTVKPFKWRASDIPRFLEAVSKLARLSAEMETDRHDVTVGLDDTTRQLFVQIGALAANCITDPTQKDAFMKNLQEMMDA